MRVGAARHDTIEREGRTREQHRTRGQHRTVQVDSIGAVRVRILGATHSRKTEMPRSSRCSCRLRVALALKEWVVWCGVAWCGVAWRVVMWCGRVWCGVAWHVVLWGAMGWYGIWNRISIA